MTDCDFCGGPRLSGGILKKKNGGWEYYSGTYNPSRNDLKASCRECMKENLK